MKLIHSSALAIEAEQVKKELQKMLASGLVAVVGTKNGEDIYDLTDKGRAEHEEERAMRAKAKEEG